MHERIESIMYASKARDRAKQIKMDALLARVSAWEATRPAAPFRSKPKYRSAGEQGLFFGAFFPFAAMGMIAGLMLTATARQPIGSSDMWLVSAVVWMPFVFGLGIPIALGILIDLINVPIYLISRRIWNKYEKLLDDWRQIGREEFQPQLGYWELRRIVPWYY